MAFKPWEHVCIPDSDGPPMYVEPAIYVIINTEDGTYWNNEFGWVGWGEHDLFSQEDKKTLNLPIGGEWEEVGSR